MKPFAQLLVAFAPVILAGIPPFLAVLKGRRLLPAFLIAWISLVGWMFFFCFLVPLAIYPVNRDLGREISLHWVPEGPAVVAIAFFGWFYAGLTILLAVFTRWLLHRRKSSLS